MERNFFVYHDDEQVRDTSIAEAVLKRLESQGLSGYLPVRDAQLGMSVFQALENGMKKTPVIIILFSEGALQRESFKLALTEGVLETLLHKNVKILPIFIDLHPTKRPAICTSIMGAKYEDIPMFWDKLCRTVKKLST